MIKFQINFSAEEAEADICSFSAVIDWKNSQYIFQLEIWNNFELLREMV